MLELLVGIDAVQRVTRRSLDPGPTRHRPTRVRRSRLAGTRDFVLAAIVALADPRPSGARCPRVETRAD